ncbi:MAG: hypothetical protein ABIK89_05700 [Planctomycetota bacterium]
MTKNRNMARKTKKIVRTPATRFTHLKKRLQKRADRTTPKTKPSSGAR